MFALAGKRWSQLEAFASFFDGRFELSESEGVFTTAQAKRMGVPRDALSHACKSGRLERVAHGAYRLAGSGSDRLDELRAVWKLTAPEKLSHERILPAAWDGVAVAGTTAASILGLGDFHLSPYRLLASRRFNTRNLVARFGVRSVSRNDTSFFEGSPSPGPSGRWPTFASTTRTHRSSPAPSPMPQPRRGASTLIGSRTSCATRWASRGLLMRSSDSWPTQGWIGSGEHAVQDACRAGDGGQAGRQGFALDTNRAIAGFFFHRLLCRVFSDPDADFVLNSSSGKNGGVPGCGVCTTGPSIVLW